MLFTESSEIHHHNKKADAFEHHEAFHHVGLLFNEPPRDSRMPLTGLPMLSEAKSYDSISPTGSSLRPLIRNIKVLGSIFSISHLWNETSYRMREEGFHWLHVESSRYTRRGLQVC